MAWLLLPLSAVAEQSLGSLFPMTETWGQRDNALPMVACGKAEEAKTGKTAPTAQPLMTGCHHADAVG